MCNDSETANFALPFAKIKERGDYSMSLFIDWLILVMLCILTISFFILALYSIKLGRELKPFKNISANDITGINEFGHATFVSGKAVQLLVKLPRLVSLFSGLGACGFILSVIATSIQICQLLSV